MSGASICAVFVCQGGPIEPQAALLAASLERFADGGLELIAAVPQDSAAPAASTLAFMRRLGVRVESIHNEVDPSYPIANKVACLGLATGAERMLFLDSDILCLRDPRDDAALRSGDVCARLTDFADLEPGEWRAIYRYVGQGEPTFDQRGLIDDRPMPLSFNSGVVGTSRAAALHRSWTAWCRRLNDVERFPKTRPFLDQIALPFAVRELGARVGWLTQAQHCSASILPLDCHAPPVFAHYYEPIHLVGDSLLAGVAERLIARHPALAPILRLDPFLGLLGRSR